MDKIKRISFSGLQLKLLGWIFTLCGAVGMAFFPGGTVGGVLKLVSYLAMPIFGFLLVEGFRCTGNLERYFMTMAVTALISEPFYDYACNGVWLDFASMNGQNFLFALFLCQIELFFLNYLVGTKRGRIFQSVALVLGCMLWAFFLNIRCGIYMTLIVGLFYLLRDRVKACYLSVAAVSIPLYFTPELALLPISRYNEERGIYNKYLFYALYPAMWAVLAGIKLLIK